MRVIYNKVNEEVKFSNMKEGTVFLYDDVPFMKVYGVTEDTVTEHCFYAVDLTCGDLYGCVATVGGDDYFAVVKGTLTIE